LAARQTSTHPENTRPEAASVARVVRKSGFDSGSAVWSLPREAADDQVGPGNSEGGPLKADTENLKISNINIYKKKLLENTFGMILL
jgi:hypothetical protein